MNDPTPTIYHVAAARDALHVDLRPASVVVHRDKILQVGRPEQVNAHDYPHARHVHLPDTLLLPAMVNAHAHLDMTALGPLPYPGSFDAWLSHVMAQSMDEQAIADSVRQGWQMSQASGVGLIGDIARSMTAAVALGDARARWRAVSFLERFGQGTRQPQAIAEMTLAVEQLAVLREKNGLRIGLEPHAPYSAGLDLYHAAADLARLSSEPSPLHLTTHLAESLEEDQFIRSAAGPIADLLKRIGKWDDSLIGHDQSPVQRLAPVLRQAKWLAAHCNYVDDRDIATLAQAQVSVAYCPIASDYFGHRGHRYRDMLAAGVNVCLGTDSILCQSPDEAQPLGVMAQMRHLFRRDGTAAATLLAMATLHGAKALDADEALVTLQADSPATLLAVSFDPHAPADALTQALRNDQPVRLLSTEFQR
jgi:cytosine/adenosine deaminase-related metal-dependent hydrolase